MDALYLLCDELRIAISYQTLDPANGLLGLYAEDEHGPGIVLDRSLESQLPLHRCVLTEEIAHYVTTGAGTIFLLDVSRDVELAARRVENRALRWAADFLIPTDELEAAISRGYRSTAELAEYFVVTPWMVERKQHFLSLEAGSSLSAQEFGRNPFALRRRDGADGNCGPHRLVFRRSIALSPGRPAALRHGTSR